jgi:hypothetical protein
VEEPEPFAPLLDVTALPIGELSGNPILARCLVRILAGLDDPHGVISAFGSAVE